MRNCPLLRKHSRTKISAQSLVEIALTLPVLLIILTGVFEFGFLLNQFLSISDSTRNAARFASDSKYDQHDSITDCVGTGATKDFYRQTACLAISELALEQPTIVLCLPDANNANARYCPRGSADGMDDIVISVFSITRHPALDILRFPSGTGEMGWSYYTDLNGDSQATARSYPHVSRFTSSDVAGMLESGGPNSSVVIVEIYYHYFQLLSLPWFTAFIPDPIMLTTYASWPQSSAEPTNTPE
jgi:hypothetical protein